MRKREIGFWLVQGPGWVLLAYLVYAQAPAAFDYELGVRMGTQEPGSEITPVGAAFWYGLAVGDLLTYIPLLAAGLIGHARAQHWGRVVLGAALGITVYWPVVCLATVFTAHGLEGWTLANETAYWLVLPVIALWGAFGLWKISAPLA